MAAAEAASPWRILLTPQHGSLKCPVSSSSLDIIQRCLSNHHREHVFFGPSLSFPDSRFSVRQCGLHRSQDSLSFPSFWPSIRHCGLHRSQDSLSFPSFWPLDTSLRLTPFTRFT
ncbi:hypothetical protein RRG08_047383 [Elysia crispata]|uniref:Uncharacterized protein n=1 Tax=Elysia crispata TaxID=231223 RepID=A0AAE0Y2E9_9GAST|nr:hypothetical protein RRG08_047383 [Elysia crispata]